MSTISVLGCGWLGQPLAKQLVEQGHDVKGSTTTESKIQTLEFFKVQPFLLKVSDLIHTTTEFLDSEILIICVPRKKLVDVDELINKIERSNIKHVLFISSTSVYYEDDIITVEISDLKPTPLAKMEEAFRFNACFTSTILRFGDLFGYERNPINFMPKGKKMTNPQGMLNMIHQDDCIAIISKIIKNQVWKTTFNACADTHPTRNNFYTKIALEAGRSKPEFDQNSPFFSMEVNSDKLKNTLDYKFIHADLMNLDLTK